MDKTNENGQSPFAEVTCYAASVGRFSFGMIMGTWIISRTGHAIEPWHDLKVMLISLWGYYLTRLLVKMLKRHNDELCHAASLANNQPKEK